MENVGVVLGACDLGFADAVKFAVMLAACPGGPSSTRPISNISIPPGCRRTRRSARAGLSGDVEVECVAYWARER
jgi:hypothetical protein